MSSGNVNSKRIFNLGLCSSHFNRCFRNGKAPWHTPKFSWALVEETVDSRSATPWETLLLGSAALSPAPSHNHHTPRPQLLTKTMCSCHNVYKRVSPRGGFLLFLERFWQIIHISPGLLGVWTYIFLYCRQYSEVSDCALPTTSPVSQPKALFSARDTGARALANVRKNLPRSKNSACLRAVRCRSLKLAGCANLGVSAATSSSLSPGGPSSCRNANLSEQSTQIQGSAS